MLHEFISCLGCCSRRYIWYIALVHAGNTSRRLQCPWICIYIARVQASNMPYHATLCSDEWPNRAMYSPNQVSDVFFVTQLLRRALVRARWFFVLILINKHCSLLEKLAHQPNNKTYKIHWHGTYQQFVSNMCEELENFTTWNSWFLPSHLHPRVSVCLVNAVKRSCLYYCNLVVHKVSEGGLFKPFLYSSIDKIL